MFCLIRLVGKSYHRQDDSIAAVQICFADYAGAKRLIIFLRMCTIEGYGNGGFNLNFEVKETQVC